MSIRESVNVAKIAELFRSYARDRKTLARQTVIAITQEMTSGRGMPLDVDGRPVEKGRLNIQ